MKTNLIFRGIGAGLSVLGGIGTFGVGLYCLATGSVVGGAIAFCVTTASIYVAYKLLDARDYPLEDQLADIKAAQKPVYEEAARYNPATGLPMLGGVDTAGNAFSRSFNDYQVPRA